MLGVFAMAADIGRARQHVVHGADTRAPAVAGADAFYLAIARSAACFVPSPRDPSPNCDRTKNQTKHLGGRFRSGSLQPIRRIIGDVAYQGDLGQHARINSFTWDF
jgi:hypothetical protein